MKFYIIAGEASGDLHGAGLIKAMHSQHPNLVINAWGGDLMEAAGATLVKHYRHLAFMGFYEVAKNISTILNNIKFCKEDILAFQPTALILIDYPGFNLRIAKWAHSKGIKVYYYISPQLWAWNTGRVHNIKKHVDRLYTILPFEKEFYKTFDFDVDYVGHPLMEYINGLEKDVDFISRNQLSEKPIVALLPGSRKQEISKMLDTFLKVVSRFPNHQFVIAGAPSISLSFYESILKKEKINIPVIENQTHALLQYAEAALVTSGTATLETALFNVPQVVCYKGNALSFQIAKRLVKVDFISLVNLIVEKELVRELIQNDFSLDNLEKELKKILDTATRKIIQDGYATIHKKLGDQKASENTARLIFEHLVT